MFHTFSYASLCLICSSPTVPLWKALCDVEIYDCLRDTWEANPKVTQSSVDWSIDLVCNSHAMNWVRFTVDSRSVFESGKFSWSSREVLVKFLWSREGGFGHALCAAKLRQLRAGGPHLRHWRSRTPISHNFPQIGVHKMEMTWQFCHDMSYCMIYVYNVYTLT